MKTILIIGANSPLAKKFILNCKNKFKFIAATTSIIDKKINIEWIDISKSIFQLKEILIKADIILNFAWARDKNLENTNLINFLIKHKKIESNLIFISSISASPNSYSSYSKNKFKISEIVRFNNQTNIFLGLVDFENSNQIKYIIKFIKFLPFSIRFSDNFFNVYLIGINSFISKLLNLVSTQNKPNSYAMYDRVFGINDFIEFIENKYHLKKKFKFIIPAILIKFILPILKKFPFKIKLIDKILTFFYKNDDWIKKLNKF